MQLRLREMRERRGLSVNHVAAMIGVKPNTYRKWELGSSGIDLEKAAACADALGCSISDIAGIDQSGMTADEREILDIYSRLSMSDKSVLMRVARALGS